MTTIRYNSTTKAIADSEGNLYALIRTIKRRSGRLAYEIRGYSKLKGMYPKHEGIYEWTSEESAIGIATQLAQYAANVPKIGSGVHFQANGATAKQANAINHSSR